MSPILTLGWWPGFLSQYSTKEDTTTAHHHSHTPSSICSRLVFCHLPFSRDTVLTSKAKLLLLLHSNSSHLLKNTVKQFLPSHKIFSLSWIIPISLQICSYFPHPRNYKTSPGLTTPLDYCPHFQMKHLTLAPAHYFVHIVLVEITVYL